jgi:hypothetical protein
VKSHPILFSSEMVRALLNTKLRTWPPEPADPTKPTKAVTRRLSKQWLNVKKGDKLWVRETHAIMSVDTGTVSIARAERMPDGKTLAETDGGLEVIQLSGEDWLWAEAHVDSDRWRPSIFMPKWACRIELECMEDARAERLQDITEDEARLEGAEPWHMADLRPDGELRAGPSQKYRAGFHELWDGLHNKPGERWDENPVVYRIGHFRRLR